MNEIERQILINQYELMVYHNDEGFFSERIKQTEQLLNPTNKKEFGDVKDKAISMPEKENFALDKDEVKE